MAFPQELLGIKVELFYDGVWNALPPGSVRGVGAEDGEISIGLRGQPDESSGIVTTQAELSVNNQNGRYSPRNLASDLYGKIGANTPIRISADVGPIINLSDPFGVPGTNGWPTGPQGYTYLAGGGSLADYFVAGGLAYHQHTATNTEHVTQVSNVVSTDHSILVTGLQLEAQPTGNHVEVVVRSREDSTLNSWVQTRIQFQTDNSIDLFLDYKDGGTVTGFQTNTVSPLATDAINVRCEMKDTRYRARVWKTSDPEPSFWHLDVLGFYTPGGKISLRSTLLTGVSNVLPFDITFQALDVQLGIALFYGEVAEWPKKWDSTGNDVWVSIQASGITRRLIQNAKPLRSAMYRWYTRRDLTAYYSLENMSGAGNAYPTIASDLNGGAPLIEQIIDPTGNVDTTWSGDKTLLGSDPLPSVTRGSSPFWSYWSYGTANILPTDITDDSFSVSFWYFVQLRNNVVSSSNSANVVVNMANGNPISVYQFLVEMNTDAGGVPTMLISAYGYSPALAFVMSIVTFAVPYLPKWRYIHFKMEKGANLVTRCFVDGVEVTNTVTAVTTVGQPASFDTVQMLVNNASVPCALGHLAVSSGQGGDDMSNNIANTLSVGINAYSGETASNRVSRLFQEEGYLVDIVNGNDTSAALGPQGTLTFLDSIMEAVKADDGVLHELRGGLGYRYITRSALYNRPNRLTLDYSNTDLGEVPETTDDDQRTMNKFSAQRKQSGAIVTYEKTTGPLSTRDPASTSSPGAGVYDDDKTMNLYEDDQLLDYAAWRVHLGTWDESRWPGIQVYLHRTPFAGNLRQLTSAAMLDVADIFTLVNTPEWLPPGSVVLQMRAVKVFLSNFNFGLEWTALPAGPWMVSKAAGNYEQNAARADTASSNLVSAITDSGTELIVLTKETNMPWCDPLWTEDVDQTDYPHETGFDLRLNPATRAGGLGGERIRLGANYTTQDTFTRTGQISGSNADTGQTWASSTMTAAQPTADGSNAVFVHAAANTEAFLVIPTSSIDGVVTLLVLPSVNQATTSTLVAHAVIRYVDANNYYAARVTLQVSAAVMTLEVIKVISGVTVVLSQPTNAPISVLTGGVAAWVKIRAYGRDLSAKIWRQIDNEPEWQIELPEVATDILDFSHIGIRTIRSVGNTNANSGFSFSRIQYNTSRVRPYAYDDFARVTVNGLGNAIVGTASVPWTIYAVTAPISASDHQVTYNQANVTIPTVGAIRGGFLQAQVLADAQVHAIVGMPLATGGSLSSVLFVRGSALLFRLVASTTNTLTITAFDTGGSLGAFALTHLTHTAGNRYHFRIFAEGNKAGAKVWLKGENEPANWQFVVTTVALTPSFCGWFGQRDSGNTNVNPQLSFEDFRISNPQRLTVQRGVEGVSRAWEAGTDVRLWTPTRLAR